MTHPIPQPINQLNITQDALSSHRTPSTAYTSPLKEKKEETEWLAGIQKKLEEPFPLSISGNTYKRLLASAEKIGRSYPESSIYKVLGGVYGRLRRGTASASEIEEVKEAEVNRENRRILLLSSSFHLPLGLKILAFSVKKGCSVDWKVIEEISCLDASSSVVARALCSLYKAVVLSGQDRERLCYNSLLGLLGHQRTEIKIKSAWILSSFSSLQKMIGALEKDVDLPVPNPRWAPGILLLTGFLLYRENTRKEETENRIISLLRKYIIFSSDEKILNGVLLLLWALSQKGRKEHLPFLAVLSLFSKYSSIKRASKGILTEHFGLFPSGSGLHLMDILSKRAQKKKEIFQLFSYFQVKRSFIREYSLRLIEEGAPSRIKLGVFLWRSSKQKEWKVNWEDISNRIASLRLSLLPGQESLLDSLLPLLSPKDLSSSSEQTEELLRLSVRVIRRKEASSENARKILLFALRKHLFLRSTIKGILSLNPSSSFSEMLKKNLSSPSCYFAYSLLTKEKLSFPEAFTTSFPSVTHLPAIYALAARGAASKRDTKKILFSSLSSYRKDSFLGDIGAYLRFDALLLLSLPLIDHKKLLFLINRFPASQRASFALLTPKLLKKRLPLTEREKLLLFKRILSLSLDKSKRISSFILEALLPSFKENLPFFLSKLLLFFNEKKNSFPLEDAVLLSGASLLKYSSLKKPIIFSLINTLLSSDNHLFKKIIKYFLVSLKAKENLPVAQEALLFFSSGTRSHLINEIEDLLK